jgi:hypothetical protein
MANNIVYLYKDEICVMEFPGKLDLTSKNLIDKIKISKSHIGNKLSKETKLKLSAAHVGKNIVWKLKIKC